MFYLCSLYFAVFVSRDSTTDVTAAVLGGADMLGRGLVLAYNSWHFVGSWLFPVGCAVVWPVWLMGWRLGCQTVCDGGSGGDEAAHSSKPHSD